MERAEETITQIPNTSDDTENYSASNDKEWLISIQKDGGEEPGTAESQKPKIQPVPKMLRNLHGKDNCFDPMIVSIGPYHHGKPGLLEAEEIKIPTARQFVQDSSNKNFDAFYNSVAAVSSNARGCYAADSKTDKLSHKEFVRMMFLDGCFILHFIDCIMKGKREGIKMKLNHIAFVNRDWFLLENQLPFVVLKALMDLKFPKDEGIAMVKAFIKLRIRALESDSEESGAEPLHLLELVRTELLGIVQQNSKEKKSEEEDTDISGSALCPLAKTIPYMKRLGLQQNMSHCFQHSTTDSPPQEGACRQTFLHLLELTTKLLGRSPTTDSSPQVGAGGQTFRTLREQTFRSVKELKTAGIKFKKSKTSCFNDISFKPGILYGTLRLPRVAISGSSKAYFLNMIAYEACPDTPDDYGITSYICFMDKLIDLPSDVKELRSEGIVQNCLGSDEEVAKWFNEIANGLMPDPSTYAEVGEGIEKMYKNKCTNWMTEWVHNHCRTPWTVIAFLAGIYVLVLGTIQTISSL